MVEPWRNQPAGRMSCAPISADAIERGEFRLEFQPVVRLGGGQVAGAEALMRWRHPRRGTIAPNEFLPLAEQAGLIDGIGDFVLIRRRAPPRRGRARTTRPGFVSVNMMPIQLRKPGIAARDAARRSTMRDSSRA